MPTFMRKIAVITRCGAMFRAEKLNELGLGDNRHSYILSLCRNPGISQDALSKKLFINKSNVTRTLATLEKLGYVWREQSAEDKRVTLVYPTQKAVDTLPKIRAVLKEWREFLTEGFTEEEIAVLDESLSRLASRVAVYAEMSEEVLNDEALNDRETGTAGKETDNK